MDINGQRRSEKFEDRGTARAGGGGGIPFHLLFSLVRVLGFKGSLILGVVGVVAFFFMPASIKQMLLGQVGGNQVASTPSGQGACQLSQSNTSACDFSRAVLASTEDVWRGKFRLSELPEYGSKVSAYEDPTLVVFSGAVGTGGCGSATSDVGPFYCPADKKLYIDPNFYQTMESHLKAPGDFAQAYVIAHEVGHHIQNLIGSSRIGVPGESKNQTSVRVELQADCLAGVWGHSARASLSIDEADLKEALTAAHAIGDDKLGHADKAEFTHGSSAQRMRWFRLGFDSGDARKCDTFVSKSSAEL